MKILNSLQSGAKTGGSSDPKNSDKTTDSTAYAPRRSTSSEKLKNLENRQETKSKPVSEDKTRSSAEQNEANMKALAEGNFREKLEAMERLSKGSAAGMLPAFLSMAQVRDPILLQLADHPKALHAVSELSSAKSSPADKVAGALHLSQSLPDATPDQMKELLNPYLSSLPSGTKLVEDIAELHKPQVSPQEKSQDFLDVANSAQETLGKLFPEFAKRWSGLQSVTDGVTAAMTLVNPEASLQDKAKAGAELFLNTKDVADKVKTVVEQLKKAKIGNVEAIAEQMSKLPDLSRIPASLRHSLDSKLLTQLKPQQVEHLTSLAAKSGNFEPLHLALSKIHSPQALDALLPALANKDASAIQSTLSLIGSMKEGVADKVLISKLEGRPATQVLAGLAEKLPQESREVLGRLIKDFDAKEIGILSKITGEVEGKTLSTTLKALDGAESRVLGKTLLKLDTTLGKLGVKMTASVGKKLMLGLGKVIPIAGVAASGYATYEMGKTAMDKSLPPELRYLAYQGAKLNGLDTALGLLEATGISETTPVGVVELPLQAGLGVGELVVDVVLSDQIEKYKADPKNWKSPLWLDGGLALSAAASGPNGFLEMSMFFGPKGTVRKLEQVAVEGGKVGAQAAILQNQANAYLVRQGMHYNAEALHGMADMVRNPEKYGQAAELMAKKGVENLSYAAGQVGEFAQTAKLELQGLVGDLKQQGAKGLKGLGWIASHPGESAEHAYRAMSDLAQKGLELHNQAGLALARQAVRTYQGSMEVLKKAGSTAEKTLAAAGNIFNRSLDEAAKLGKEGVEWMGWVASHPGQTAKIAGRKLVDLAVNVNELHQEAYQQILNLGAKGTQLAGQVVKGLENLGEQGVDSLLYIAKHPGESAHAAMQSLGKIARTTSKAAKQATDALLDLVNQGDESAKKVVSSLLVNGGKAAERIVAIWKKELSSGAREILSGLQDLGGAGAEALQRLHSYGVHSVTDFMNGAWESVFGK